MGVRGCCAKVNKNRAFRLRQALKQGHSEIKEVTEDVSGRVVSKKKVDHKTCLRNEI